MKIARSTKHQTPSGAHQPSKNHTAGPRFTETSGSEMPTDNNKRKSVSFLPQSAVIVRNSDVSHQRSKKTKKKQWSNRKPGNDSSDKAGDSKISDDVKQQLQTKLATRGIKRHKI